MLHCFGVVLVSSWIVRFLEFRFPKPSTLNPKQPEKPTVCINSCIYSAVSGQECNSRRRMNDEAGASGVLYYSISVLCLGFRAYRVYRV